MGSKSVIIFIFCRITLTTYLQRTSKQYIQGLTVAQTEYDRELKARRDAEAEVTRLRVLLSGQVARLTAMSGDARREELRQQLSKELNDNLSGLEYDLSRLKVERDMTLAEVEELSATKRWVYSSSIYLILTSILVLPLRLLNLQLTWAAR